MHMVRYVFTKGRVFDNLLRRELTSPEPQISDGVMALPDGPGLGIDLNDDLVARLRVP